MTNPFEDTEAAFHVLLNAEGQYSLWPAALDVPAGWTIVRHAAPHAECVAYVDSVWTDMRPRSLAAAMGDLTEEAGGDAR